MSFLFSSKAKPEPEKDPNIVILCDAIAKSESDPSNLEEVKNTVFPNGVTEFFESIASKTVNARIPYYSKVITTYIEDCAAHGDYSCKYQILHSDIKGSAIEELLKELKSKEINASIIHSYPGYSVLQIYWSKCERIRRIADAFHRSECIKFVTETFLHQAKISAERGDMSHDCVIPIKLRECEHLFKEIFTSLGAVVKFHFGSKSDSNNKYITMHFKKET
jgi:hypothetical protein